MLLPENFSELTVRFCTSTFASPGSRSEPSSSPRDKTFNNVTLPVVPSPSPCLIVSSSNNNINIDNYSLSYLEAEFSHIYLILHRFLVKKCNETLDTKQNRVIGFSDAFVRFTFVKRLTTNFYY